MVGTWQRLAHVELSSAGDTIDTGTFTAKENLKVIVFGIGSGTLNTNMRFNSDSGSNYAWRCERDGNGSDDTSVSQAQIAFGGGANVFIECNITNKSDKEKLLVGNKMTTNSGSGAGYAPDRREQIGKWANTSNSITSIQALNAGTGDFASGSYITVWGASDDVVSDEKDDITNVPANTRYEETDTRKIYRLASSGTQSNTLGSDGDATNNGADLDTTNQKLGTGCLDLEKDNDDYINATNLLTNSAMGSTGTISLWFKPESLGGYIWSVGDSNGTAGRIYLEQQSTSVWTVFCQIGSSSQWKVDSTGVTFSTGTWYHIVITHDGGSSYGAAKLYINGVDRSSNSNNGTTWNKWVGDLSGLDNMAFGRHHHNNVVYTQDSDGLMDDIGVWNRALTSTEVTSLYNSGTGKPCNSIPSGLRAYYDCNSATVTNNTSAFTEWKERGTA